MNQEEQDKLNQIEADAHRGVFSERDVCALVQCYRERNAEVRGLRIDLEGTEALRVAAIERENNAIAERDIARRQTAALERLSPPMRSIHWIVEHLKQTTPEVAAVREWLQRLEEERE